MKEAASVISSSWYQTLRAPSLKVVLFVPKKALFFPNALPYTIPSWDRNQRSLTVAFILRTPFRQNKDDTKHSPELI